MQITSRFTIAVHVLVALDYFKDKQAASSDFLAGSVGTNPVIIRTVLSKLRTAGIVSTHRGSRGATIEKPMTDISLYDIYKAVDSVKEEGLFHFHEQPCPDCPIGRNIHFALDSKLDYIQNAMEAAMKEVSLADVADEARHALSLEEKEAS